MFKPEEFHALDEKVKAVGVILGMTFDQEHADKRKRDEERWSYWGRLNNGTKAISFHTGDYKLKDRWQIRAEFPRDAKGQLNTGYSQKWPEIQVSMAKDAEKIARDIKSRLIPEYEKQLAEVITRNEFSNKYHADRLASMQKIAQYLGLPLPTDDSKANLYPEGGHEKGIYKIEPYSYGRVKMDVQCTPDKAIEILKIMGQ